MIDLILFSCQNYKVLKAIETNKLCRGRMAVYFGESRAVKKHAVPFVGKHIEF